MNPSHTQRSQESYEAYVEKYVNPPKTKDDSFTPPAVFDCVKKWVFEKYPQFTEKDIIRPFWPGADLGKFAKRGYNADLQKSIEGVDRSA